MNKKEQANIQKMEQVIKDNKKIVNEYSKKIDGRIFENIVIAIVYIVYFYLLYLGSQNIESAIYIVDLKAFAVGLLATAIILFEISYNKDNGNLCIHGIEVLILAIVTLFLVYAYSLFIRRMFVFIIVVLLLISVIYFAVKSLIIFLKMKKKYFKSKNDIKDIIK